VYRFIVGTGRCGSTLLSKMIRENERVASIFEYFSGLDRKVCFSRSPIDAESFAAMHCDDQTITNMVLARGYRIAEVRYPFDAPGARFSREGGLPFIAAATLSTLPVDDVDGLYDEVRSLLLSLPARPAAEQHIALFDWLTERLDREVWVERSGGSIENIAELNALFPGARFLHIHRRGEEAALSMREHHVFRLGISLMYDLPLDPGPASSEGEPDRITQLLESRPASEYFGRAWSEQLLRGFRGIAALDADQYREVSFEDLIASPREVLVEIANFLELPDRRGAWLDRAALLVTGMPPTRAEELETAERERLEQVCRPGNTLLGRC